MLRRSVHGEAQWSILYIFSFSACQAWSLRSIKCRSHWCRYWPRWDAAGQVATLARSCCGQTQKQKHQGVWPHGPSPETVRLRPVILLDAIQTPSQKWPRKHSGAHLLRPSSGTGWECVLNIYIRGPLRLKRGDALNTSHSSALGWMLVYKIK